jgi:cation transporter-like permease
MMMMLIALAASRLTAMLMARLLAIVAHCQAQPLAWALAWPVLAWLVPAWAVASVTLASVVVSMTWASSLAHQRHRHGSWFPSWL